MKNKWHYASNTKDMTDFIIQQIVGNIVPQELISHINSVTYIVFSPDGSKFISGSLSEKDKTCSNLFMWDTKTGKRVLKLKVNPEYISTVNFSPNGRQIVTSGGSDKNNLAVWNAYTGAMIFSLIDDNTDARSAAFTPDGKKIISVDLSNRESDITVWDAHTGKKVFNINRGDTKRNTSGVVISPDGMKIAAFSQYSEFRDITITDINTGVTLLRINNFTHNITALEFSPDGTKIVSGNMDNLSNIVIWDAQTGEKLTIIEGHHCSTRSKYSSCRIQSVQFSPNGKYIASTTYEDRNNFILWNAQTGEKLFDLIGHHGYINSVMFTPDSNYIISSSSEEEVGIVVWDIHTGKKLFNLINHPLRICSVGLSPDGNTIVAGGYGEKDNLAIWRVPFDLIAIIQNDLNEKQIELLYNHYRTCENEIDFTLIGDSSDYATYQSLPDLVKKAIHQKTNISPFCQLQSWFSSNFFRLEIIINKIWEEQRLNCRRKILLLKREINDLLWKRNNKLEFAKLNFSSYGTHSFSSGKMIILGYFLMDDVGNHPSSFKEWGLADKWKDDETTSSNCTFLEKEGNYIVLSDLHSEEEVPTVLKLTKEQYEQILTDWEKKVCKLKPKEVIITYQYDEFKIEIKD